MAIPRSQLITGVTNDPFYAGEDMIPTSLALSRINSAPLLSGTMLILGNLINCGYYRYPSNTSDLPRHLLGSTGFVFVMHQTTNVTDGIFGQSDTTTDAPTELRQVVWADDNSIPYTRTKLSGTTSWTKWSAFGGTNPIVLIDKNMVAVENTTYYGYGDYTLTLPPLSDSEVVVGTTIVLNQFAGSTYVTDGEDFALQHPALKASTTNVWVNDPDYRGSEIQHFVGAQYYLIKVEADSTVTGGKKWVSYAKNGLHQALENLEKRFDSKEKKTKVFRIGGNVIDLTSACIDIYGNSVTFEEIVRTTNPTITPIVPASTAVTQKLILPNASAELAGTEVTILMPTPDQRLQVSTANGKFEEIFVNNYSNSGVGYGTQGLILKFMVVNDVTSVDGSLFMWVVVGYNE